MTDSVLIEGVRYVRPFGRRKILYLWERIEKDILNASSLTFAIPMANGGYIRCHSINNVETIWYQLYMPSFYFILN